MKSGSEKKPGKSAERLILQLPWGKVKLLAGCPSRSADDAKELLGKMEHLLLMILLEECCRKCAGDWKQKWKLEAEVEVEVAEEKFVRIKES